MQIIKLETLSKSRKVASHQGELFPQYKNMHPPPNQKKILNQTKPNHTKAKNGCCINFSHHTFKKASPQPSLPQSPLSPPTLNTDASSQRHQQLRCKRGDGALRPPLRLDLLPRPQLHHPLRSKVLHPRLSRRRGGSSPRCPACQYRD